ncbi:MAG: type II secretion system protein [Candidatus Wallbacteria bacterium]|nr:type II secretion system protein [Candidatus Wallbacteria bacterium]
MLSRKGFTLAGICLAVVIVGISARAAFPVYGMVARSEKEEEMKFMLSRFARAILLYHEQNRDYPDSLDQLYTKKFLRKKYSNPFIRKDKPEDIKPFEGYQAEKNERNKITRVRPMLEVKKGDINYNNWYYTVTRKDQVLQYTFSGKKKTEKPG